MAKLTRAVCDFCGGKLGEPHGTLTLPVIDASKPAPKQESPDEIFRTMLALGGMWGTGTKTRAYDICRDCGEGLVRWRHAAIEKLIADGFEKV